MEMSRRDLSQATIFVAFAPHMPLERFRAEIRPRACGIARVLPSTMACTSTWHMVRVTSAAACLSGLLRYHGTWYLLLL